MSTPNDASAGAGSSSATSGGGSANQPFVNEGFQRWEAQRKEWRKRPEGWKRPKKRMLCLDIDEVYEDLLYTRRRFPEKIPLRDMIDLLIDIWEQDGLYG